jgi:hypothetical protein
MSKEFKPGQKVLIARKALGAGYYWNSNMDNCVGKEGVVQDTSNGRYKVFVEGDRRPWWYLRDALEEVAASAPVGKVRMLERGKLLDTEFDSPVAAGDWLRDNGVTGEFELIRVESLGKIKASITVEAA